jgi:hypothetical protein
MNGTLYRSYRKKWRRQGEYYYDCHNRNENNTYNYTSSGNIPSLPEDTMPTDIMDTNEGWKMSVHQPLMKKEKESDVPRRAYNTVLYTNRFLSGTTRNICVDQIHEENEDSNRWRSNTNQRISRIRLR